MGRLFVDGDYECETLEDVVRDGPKVYGETAIPAATYQIVIDYSNRFRCDMPRLLDVPGFTGIRIHPGNTDADTHGCILVGVERSGESIRNSRVAYNRLFDQMVKAKNAGERIDIWIEGAP